MTDYPIFAVLFNWRMNLLFFFIYDSSTIWIPMESFMDMDEKARLHVLGATVIHNSPFEHLSTPQNDTELSLEFIQQWVKPLYLDLLHPLEELSDDHLSLSSKLSKISPHLTEEIVSKLLGEFNWRTRITGAYYAALKRYVSFEETIGNLLLTSEVCYAGNGYCIALASFNSPRSVQFIKCYLEYYLSRPDLNYDQEFAMKTLVYLDNCNGTQECRELQPLWSTFHQQQNLETPRCDEEFAVDVPNILEMLTKAEQNAIVKST